MWIIEVASVECFKFFLFFWCWLFILLILAVIVAQSLDHDSSGLLFDFGVLFKL